jgi:hypothetical protein
MDLEEHASAVVLWTDKAPAHNITAIHATQLNNSIHLLTGSNKGQLILWTESSGNNSVITPQILSIRYGSNEISGLTSYWYNNELYWCVSSIEGYVSLWNSSLSINLISQLVTHYTPNHLTVYNNILFCSNKHSRSIYCVELNSLNTLAILKHTSNVRKVIRYDENTKFLYVLTNSAVIYEWAIQDIVQNSNLISNAKSKKLSIDKPHGLFYLPIYASNQLPYNLRPVTCHIIKETVGYYALLVATHNIFFLVTVEGSNVQFNSAQYEIQSFTQQQSNILGLSILDNTECFVLWTSCRSILLFKLRNNFNNSAMEISLISKLRCEDFSAMIQLKNYLFVANQHGEIQQFNLNSVPLDSCATAVEQERLLSVESLWTQIDKNNKEVICTSLCSLIEENSLRVVRGYSNGDLRLFNPATEETIELESSSTAAIQQIIQIVDSIVAAVDVRNVVFIYNVAQSNQLLASLSSPSSAILSIFTDEVSDNLYISYTDHSVAIYSLNLLSIQLLYHIRGLSHQLLAVYRPEFCIAHDWVMLLTDNYNIFLYNLVDGSLEVQLDYNTGAQQLLFYHNLFIPHSQLSITASEMSKKGNQRSKEIAKSSSVTKMKPFEKLRAQLSSVKNKANNHIHLMRHAEEKVSNCMPAPSIVPSEVLNSFASPQHWAMKRNSVTQLPKELFLTQDDNNNHNDHNHSHTNSANNSPKLSSQVVLFPQDSRIKLLQNLYQLKATEELEQDWNISSNLPSVHSLPDLKQFSLLSQPSNIVQSSKFNCSHFNFSVLQLNVINLINELRGAGTSNSNLNSIIALLLDWNCAEYRNIEEMLNEQFNIHQPKLFASPAILSADNHAIAILLPNPSNPSYSRYRYDSCFSAESLLLISCFSVALLQSFDAKTQIYWSQVATHYTAILANNLSSFKQPDLDFLSHLTLHNNYDVADTAHLLLRSTINKYKAQQKLTILNNRIANFPVMKYNQNDIYYDYHAVETNHPVVIKISLSQLQQLIILCELAFTDFTPETCHNNPTDLVAAFQVISCRITLILVAFIAQYNLHDAKNNVKINRLLLVLEILWRGLELFLPAISNSLALLRKLYYLSLSNNSLLNNSCNRAIIEFGRLDSRLIMQLLAKEINNETNPTHQQHALNILLTLAKRSPLSINKQLPSFIQLLIDALEPNSNSNLRKNNLNKIVDCFIELSSIYPNLLYHKASNRVFIGCGSQYDNLLIVYDIATADRYRIFQGSSKEISAIAVNAAGNIILSYSIIESNIRVWRIHSKTVNFLSLLTNANQISECSSIINLNSIHPPNAANRFYSKHLKAHQTQDNKGKIVDERAADKLMSRCLLSVRLSWVEEKRAELTRENGEKTSIPINI